MTTTITPPETRPATTPVSNSLTAGKLPNGAPWMILGASLVISAGLFGVIAFAGAEFNWVGALLVGAILYVITVTLLSRIVEGARRATDRFVTALVTGAFLLAMIPLVSLTITVVTFGLARFDAEFFSYSMRSITGEGGGALHAIVGTLLMTGTAALISIPIGLMTSIYLV
jgi:phosphate transport system permease protein